MNCDPQLISNIVLSVLSVLLVIISVVVSVFTLHQNSRMIEASSRPYIGVSSLYINNGSPTFELVVKNYGLSAGKITKFACNADLSRYAPGDDIRLHPLFNGIEGTTLMPGQKLFSVIDTSKMKDDGIESLKFAITYASGGKIYKEECIIGVAINSNLVSLRTRCGDDPLKNISYALQTITERMD